MIIKADKACFVFDLDDTLYSEIDFLKSAYKEIASYVSKAESEKIYAEMFRKFMAGENAFEFLTETFPARNLSIQVLLDLYRNHIPHISLRKDVPELLVNLKSKGCFTGLITNGRSITQRNKIKALGLDNLITKIAISEEFGHEKPNMSIFQYISDSRDCYQFYYLADNLKIDFISPKKLGWCCIGVLGSDNIHGSELSDLPYDYFPHLFIENFSEIKII